MLEEPMLHQCNGVNVDGAEKLFVFCWGDWDDRDRFLRASNQLFKFVVDSKPGNSASNRSPQ